MLLIVAKIRIRHTIQGASDAKAFFPYIHENTPVKIPSKRHLAHHRIIAPDAPSTRPQSAPLARATPSRPSFARPFRVSSIDRSRASIARSRVDARDESNRAVERAAGPFFEIRGGSDRSTSSVARDDTAPRGIDRSTRVVLIVRARARTVSRRRERGDGRRHRRGSFEIDRSGRQGKDDVKGDATVDKARARLARDARDDARRVCLGVDVRRGARAGCEYYTITARGWIPTAGGAGTIRTRRVGTET